MQYKTQSCQERETIHAPSHQYVIALISIYDTACVYANITVYCYH